MAQHRRVPPKSASAGARKRGFPGYLRVLLLLPLVGVLSVMPLFAAVYWGWFGPLPSRAELGRIQHHEATEVMSADGEILGKYYLENRVIVPPSQVSPWVTKALVATEDSRFFEHRGIDLISLGRVLVRTIIGGDSRQGGGSTISQQLAKNLYPRQGSGSFRMLIHKVREMIIATRLERVYSKEELLHLYLNTVPFGDNIYGIEVAARRFFGIPARDLDASAAALLVGMLKGNSIYHPVRHPERALERRNVVLKRMQEQGDLTAVQYEANRSRPLRLNYTRESHHQGLATYFREHLRTEADSLVSRLRKPDGERYNLYTDGLRIHTTIHAGMQRIAEEGMRTHMISLQTAFDQEWKGGKPWGSDEALDRLMRQTPRWKAALDGGLSEEEARKEFREPVEMTVFTWQGPAQRRWTPMDSLRYTISLLHAGILAGDPADGAILVWVGGIGQQFFQYDQVKARRQVGSTFKPVVYAAALEAGFGPCDYFENQEITYPEYQDWTPRNASGQTGGVYTMSGALSQSLNTITASLMMGVGIDRVREVARKMGVQADLPQVPSLALGVAETSLLDILTLYGTLANEGLRPRWYYISRIEDREGEVLWSHSAEENRKDFVRALEPEHALYLRHALEMAVDSGTARALRSQFALQAPMAGKTGTTQDHGDGWFAGFSARLVAVSRVGATLPTVHFKSLRLGAASRTAMPLVGRLWQGCQRDPALRAYVQTPFPPLPEHVQAALDCPPYLEAYPDLAESSDGGILDRLGFRKEEKEAAPVAAPAPSEAGERLRKENEKRRRKQERQDGWKRFWDGILGRD